MPQEIVLIIKIFRRIINFELLQHLVPAFSKKNISKIGIKASRSKLTKPIKPKSKSIGPKKFSSEVKRETGKNEHLHFKRGEAEFGTTGETEQA